ncbi:MAG TPA: hypothetical protein V6C81_23260 [Planktothrix sp.]|jgi:hypothetical protein
MHDCPTCKVPLHGHEEVCPSCGTKQYVRPEYRRANLPPQPGVNPLPIVVAVLVVGVVLVLASSSSWIGQLMTRGPVQEDPMAKVTPAQARATIEDQITKGLAAAGAKGTIKYTAGGAESTRDAQGPVEMAVDMKGLKDPNQRHNIFDPIKDYLAPGKITSLTINDVEGKTTRTWTYSPAPAPSQDTGSEPIPDLTGSGTAGSAGSSQQQADQ